jgi:hypothetical protein
MAIPVSSTTLAAYILEGPYFAIVIGQWVRVLHTVSHFSSAIVKVDRGCIDTIQSFSRVPHARSPSDIVCDAQHNGTTYLSGFLEGSISVGPDELRRRFLLLGFEDTGIDSTTSAHVLFGW